MSILQFLKSKRVWYNLIAMVLLTVLLVFGVLTYLKSYTRHNETIEAPNFKGLVLSELDQYTTEEYFDFIVIDSVYNSKKEKGSILAQDPLPGSTIKKGRKIYLTIVSMEPEKIKMPDLKDLTLRQAKAILNNYGLNIHKLEYVSSNYQNAVEQQKYMGQPIEPGEKIEKGSAITLVLGYGKREEKIDIPFLIGMKKKEAIDNIHLNSLNVGRERYYNPSDTAGVRVYDQSPKPYKNKTLKMGQSIDLVYRNNRKFDFESYIQQYRKDSLKRTTADTPDIELN
ncbi:MAG: PASTA domain-containing protein [Bacteroidales bacterium]